MVNYASIVPLIGGETIAMQKVLGQKPEYILSYEGFEANDKHLLEHYKNKVPYHLIKDDQLPNVESVDIINTVCPCAGLSSLSPSSSSESATNDWMRTSAEYILGTISPTVFWGENAPRLASKKLKMLLGRWGEILLILWTYLLMTLNQLTIHTTNMRFKSQV